MSIEKVRDYFKQWDLDSRIQEFETSSATVELAAQALGCAPERIAKTLSFKLAEKCVLVVTAGDAKIDNAKFKAHFKTKAKMLSPAEVDRCIGHGIGGVCPFAINADVDVYLDHSLQRFETVFPACGSSNSVIELTIDELVKYSNSVAWSDVCKNWQSSDLS
jgi:prolyl-tRNA editing enzyme YbaK/EbsC (Cys-tRNA(Pro) deacylase)